MESLESLYPEVARENGSTSRYTRLSGFVLSGKYTCQPPVRESVAPSDPTRSNGTRFVTSEAFLCYV